MKHRKLWYFGALASLATLLGGGCDSDDTQDNPSYTTGGTRTTGGTHASPEGGENGFGFAGENTILPGGGKSSTGGKSNTGGKSGTGGTAASLGGAEPGAAGTSTGGEGGGGNSEVPPYDCVLHPKTHLEIINACTDATRVEKHPVLPAIP